MATSVHTPSAAAPAPPGPASVRAMRAPDHSTNLDMREYLRQLSCDSFHAHAQDLQAAHTVLEGFMDTIMLAIAAQGNGKSLAGPELLKTPGRKRAAALANSTRKDPFATVLFPTAAPRPLSASQMHDQENGGSPARPIGSRDHFSPKSAGRAKTIRDFASPRQSSKIVERSASKPTLDPLVPVVQQPLETVVSPTESVPSGADDSTAVESERADLSMIGEEEEGEDEVVQRRLVGKSPLKNAVAAATEEVDRAALARYTVPLNDGPNRATTSFPSTTEVQTPGNSSTATVSTGTSSRFAPASAKHGAGHASSSPPALSFAASRPSAASSVFGGGLFNNAAPTGTFGGVSRPTGASIGGFGGKLNFVGLPSLRDRETMTFGSRAAGSLGGATSLNPLKRKSLPGADEASKLARPNEDGKPAETRLDTIKSRLQSMAPSGAARHTLGSSTSGINLAASTKIPQAAPPLASAAIISPPVMSPRAVSSNSPLPGLTRKNSVNQLVQSFNRNSDARLPSPTKLPSPVKAFNTMNANIHTLSPSASPRSRALTATDRLNSPSPPTPRMILRSPPRAFAPVLSTVKSPLRTATSIQQSSSSKTVIAEEVMEEPVRSTTPLMSPPKQIVAATARSILQEMAAAEEVGDISLVQLQTQTLQQMVSGGDYDDEDLFDVQEANEPPLPPALEMHSPVDDIAHDQYKGGLANAFGTRPQQEFELHEEEDAVIQTAKTVVATSPVKITIPGSFGLEDDGDVEDLQPFFTKQPSTDTLLSKKSSNNSLASSTETFDRNSMLGSSFGKALGKKGKTEVKSVQLAAAAAKKEAQEKERKAGIKEKGEQRRAAVLQKKADDDRQKLDDERNAERKIREEAAASLAAASAKSKLVRQKSKLDVASEPEQPKKRKVEVAEVKRVEIKKPREVKEAPSRPASAQSTYATGSSVRAPVASTSVLKPTTGKSSMAGSSKFMPEQARVPAQAGSAKVSHVNPAAYKGLFTSQSSHHPVASGSQTQHRPAPRPVAPVEPEEDIVLPDIASEYSDSEDEDRDAKTKALPFWAQSPALADALYRQQNINPDDIFGVIPTLEMGDIFRHKTTRITKRTSSAVWEGSDALTDSEKLRYNRQMGFVALPPSRLSRQ